MVMRLNEGYWSQRQSDSEGAVSALKQGGASLFFMAHKSSADIGAFLVYIAFACHQEFTSVFDEKFMVTNHGKFQAGSTNRL